jgi:ubiquinone biosynthesis protein UbiJ
VDPDVDEHLESLEGNLLGFYIKGLPGFFVKVNNGSVQLISETTEVLDATVRMELFVLVKAYSRPGSSAGRENLRYEIDGSAGTVMAIEKVLASLEPLDWEELLSQILGDTLARKAGRSFLMTRDWARSARCSATQNLAEYLQEERQLLPTRLQIERHFGEVLRLREAADTLETRLVSLVSRRD